MLTHPFKQAVLRNNKRPTGDGWEEMCTGRGFVYLQNEWATTLDVRKGFAALDKGNLLQ